MITFLGTILFATILYIGSLDGRSSLGLFGRYGSPGLARNRPRPAAAPQGGNGDKAS